MKSIVEQIFINTFVFSLFGNSTLIFNKTKRITMKNILMSSAGTLVIGFLCTKFLPPSIATIAVPAISALAGIILKQGPQQAATSGAIGGGVLGALSSALGDPGLGSILSGVLGSDMANGVLGSLLGGGVLGGAGGGIGGFIQNMLNKSKV